MSKLTEQKETTGKSVTPAFAIIANRRKIENAVEYLTLLYTPLVSEKAKEELMKIKNLGAAMEFMEENTDEAFSESLRILNELYDYQEKQHYFALVSSEHLNETLKLLLLNLATVFDNAKSLSFRCLYAEHDNPFLQEISKPVGIWSNAVVEVVKSVLLYLGENVLTEKNLKILLKKVYGLNGELIQLIDVGF